VGFIIAFRAVSVSSFQPLFEHHRRHLRNPVARQHPTDGEHRGEESGDEQDERNEEEDEDEPAGGCHGSQQDFRATPSQRKPPFLLCAVLRS
jgi:hypothetical protein